jgi:hypothetical protein
MGLRDMIETAETSVLERVRQLVTSAHQARQPTPGRPTLVKLTGASDWSVRKALEELEAAGELDPPVDSDEDTITGDLDALDAAEIIETTPVETPVPDAGASAGEAGGLPRPWPLVFIGLAAAVAIWGGWVRLGELTGFGPINLLPGVGGGFTLNTAVVLPLSVEFYSAYALRVLLASDRLTVKTRRFARNTFITSLVVGGGAQVSSHIMAASSVTSAPWQVTTLVSCVPVLVLGLATGLAALVKRDSSAGEGERGE